MAMNCPIDTAHLMEELKSRKRGKMIVNVTLNESNIQLDSNVSTGSHTASFP